MKTAGHSEPLSIPADIAAKCDAPNQAENFDRGLAFLAVPKSAILKEEAKVKRKHRKKAS